MVFRGEAIEDDMRVSAVIPAYNEERNIERMLDSLLAQRMTRGDLLEAVVVASGCTDSTCEVVRGVMGRNRRVRLLNQDVRMGKAAAFNAYFREHDPRADVILMASADILLQPGFVDLLLAAFEDPSVGMCGGRPMPTNSRDTLAGRVVHFLWDMHHDVALKDPKLGEATAIRARLVRPLPELSPVDEASLEAQVREAGLMLRYVPEAVLANRGPDNLREFFSQRRRIAAGHFWLRETAGYSVATMDVGRIVRLALRYPTFTDPGTDAAYLVAAGLETAARALGLFDAMRGHSHAIWSIAPSAHQAIGSQEREADPNPVARASHG
jgi:biofilm PGA synthesis N-glycosyltransferase PgaC